MFFLKPKKLIGLDIGTTSIKMAELDISNKTPKLLSIRLIPTPPNCINAGEISDVSTISGAIKSLYSELKTNRKAVATALWGTAVIVKKITMPKMDKKMIREQIHFEAEQYIPFDIKNVSLDFHILKYSSTPETIDVLVIAAQNELTSQYTSVIEFSRLKAEVLDVSGFALANCFEANYGKLGLETIGLFNFGAAVTNFVVISNGEVIFTRDIPVGGSVYTNEISRNLGITFSEAEALKIDAVSGRETPDQVNSIITATNELVVEEIRNTIEFLVATSNGLVLSKCYYTGGSSLTTGLINAVSNSISVEFLQLNPFRSVIVDSKRNSTNHITRMTNFSSLAIGLGLRKIGDS